MFYRLLLAILLIVLFFGEGPYFLGRTSPVLFSIVCLLYLGLVISGGLFLHWRSPGREQQAYAMVFIDIVAITLLMHSSGGISSGLGMLLAVSIAGGATMMGGQAALLFASIAALAIITEQVFAELAGSYHATSYTQAGLLGATFLAVALLTHVLSNRARESEKLAHRHARDLARMAQLNNCIIQSMATGVLAVDDKNCIRLINGTARQLLGTPDARVDDLLATTAPELLLQLQHWDQDPDYLPQPLVMTPSSGEVLPSFRRLSEEGMSNVLIFLEDISQITRQAQQMKLASLGRLTASIAHEIRNPLGAISHAGQLFAESPNLDKADRRLTEIIQTNSKRVNQVIENVLQLSRREGANPKTLQLRAWFEEFLDDYLESHAVSPDSVSLQIEPGDCEVYLDPGQLRQIVANLCDNALRFANLESVQQAIRISGGLAPESEIPFVDIIDNGPGIAPDVVRQIFEPFYTTGSQGTGLGLYIAKELSEVNGIALEYLPVPAGGSCFRLSFRNKEIR